MSLRFSSVAIACAVAMLSVVPSWGQTEDAVEPPPVTKEEMSYSIGVEFGRALQYSDERIDLGILLSGIEDIMAGADMSYPDDVRMRALQEFQRVMQQDQQEALAAEGKVFLDENAKKEGVVALPSGLQYKVITKGTGRTPTAADTVETHYRGTFINGTEFDSSYKRNAPATFPVGQVIAGWTEALQLMKEGGKWELYIPYDLAYGPQGRQGIPPYSMLTFEIELLRIVDNP